MQLAIISKSSNIRYS